MELIRIPQPDPELDLRNRAYTYLKIAEDEIRDCGKYAFSGDEVRLKEYRSEYMHRQNNQYRKTDEAEM